MLVLQTELDYSHPRVVATLLSVVNCVRMGMNYTRIRRNEKWAKLANGFRVTNLGVKFPSPGSFPT